MAPGQFNNRRDNTPMPLIEVIVTPVAGNIVGTLGIQEVMEIGRPGVVCIKGDGPHFPLGLQLEGVIVGTSILTNEGRADELGIGATLLGKGNHAGLRLIDIECVVETSAPRPDIGGTQSDFSHLTFKAEIELVDRAVVGFHGKAAYALGRNDSRLQTFGKRSGEGEEGLSVDQFIDICFADLKRTSSLNSGKRTDPFAV